MTLKRKGNLKDD